VQEENFWTLWCKGRLTEADTPTIRLGATPSELTSAHLHHPPIFFTGRMPFLLPNQQCQSTECNISANTDFIIFCIRKSVAFASFLLPNKGQFSCFDIKFWSLFSWDNNRLSIQIFLGS